MNRLKYKFKTIYRKNEEDFKAIIQKRYPDFVYKRLNKLAKNEIPIFVFHSVQPEFFESQIRYLALNGYRTLSADELYEIITNGRELLGKAVALTFDDGRGSLWTTGYPLLKKYGLSAICFLVPYQIKKGTTDYPTVDKFWEGKVTRDEIVRREVIEPLCTWKEIAKMHESKVIDFQSHTSYHHSVFVNNRLIDFINPNLMPSFLASDLNSVIRKNDKDDYFRNTELGQPIYQYAPSMASKTRYLEDEKLNQACISFVKERGGITFFKQNGWRSKLINCHRAFKKNNKTTDKYQSIEERYEEIKLDLLQSKQAIEKELGKKVRHLCYPWYAGSSLSVKASKDAGYLSNYWGILGQKAINLVGQSPMHLSRLNDEYIFALPGKGRKSLLKILFDKVLRLQTQKRFMRT
jgi:peptidoglycan/xylan/chitin deacetylase (PgdA/CDA1 family)